MDHEVVITPQDIFQQIESLPQADLLDLAEFIRFLRARHRPNGATVQTTRLIDLRGMLKGYDFSPELLAEVRREMWRKFQD